MSKTGIAGLLLVALFVSSCKANSSIEGPGVAAASMDAIFQVEPIQNECLACHTDKQMLIDTARPEEVVAVESSGTG